MQPYNEEEPKGEQIRSMFDRIAPNYDRLNRLLSFGIDRRWRRRLALEAQRDRPERLLDVATGTGDLALALARRLPGASIVGADISERMIEIARSKAAKKDTGSNISFIVADGERLPFADGEFDAATIAFGIRNFDNIPAGIAETARVLRPGGKLYVLEFSTPRGRLFGPLYLFYFHRLLPFLGGIISGDGKAYRYLPGSVAEFPRPDDFAGLLRSHGFSNGSYKKLTGGVSILYVAEKG